MLGNDVFYYNIIRKYVVAFGMIFSDVHVLHTDATNAVVKDIKVPITFASKSKMAMNLKNKNSSYNSTVQVGAILPKMGFVLQSIESDSTRKLNSLNEINIPVYDTSVNPPVLDKTKDSFIYHGIPYNFNFSLGVWTKNLDDLFQIVEQVLTFFKPDYTLSIKEISELGITREVPVVITSTDLMFENEFDEMTWRVVKADLNFTLKGWLYPPIKEGKVILHIKNNIYNPDDNRIAQIAHDYDAVAKEIITTITENVD